MSDIFNSIKSGLEEAIQHEKGLLKARTNKISISPIKTFSPEQIKMIRTREGMTQALFARFMGVSPKTIEAWEAGTNKPAGPASRMFELLEKEPSLPVKYNIVIK